MAQILVLHEPTCNRDPHPCSCGMYAVEEPYPEVYQCLGAFHLTESELSELLSNDSIGGC